MTHQPVSMILHFSGQNSHVAHLITPTLKVLISHTAHSNCVSSSARNFRTPLSQIHLRIPADLMRSSSLMRASPGSRRTSPDSVFATGPTIVSTTPLSPTVRFKARNSQMQTFEKRNSLLVNSTRTLNGQTASNHQLMHSMKTRQHDQSFLCLGIHDLDLCFLRPHCGTYDRHRHGRTLTTIQRKNE